MMHILSDVRFAWRGLRKTPLFTFVAVVSIALGIGANTAVFTLVDQVLLRLLPVKDPQQLVLVTSEGYQYGNAWGNGNELSYPMFTDLRDHNAVFSGMFGRFAYPLQINAGGRTERVDGELVSGTYFDVLGVGAHLGRTFGPDDDRAPGAHPVAILSHAYWKSRFASDPAIVGKPIIVSSIPMTIVGVAQEGFQGASLGAAAQVYVPIMMMHQLTPMDDVLAARRSRWVNVFGRLRPGITATQAQAALQPFYASRLQMEVTEAGFARAAAEDKAQFLKGTVGISPAGFGKSDLRAELTRPLWVLMTIVGCVLLIACANVANLLLARASTRQREIAMRLALGATRQRILQQLLVESVLLSLLGGAGGLLLATFGAEALLDFFRTPDAQLTISASPDVRILAFTIAISLATGLVFGLLPARQSTRPELAPTLKNEAGSVVGGSQVRLRKALVVAQVALSLLLLIGAGLFIRSLHNLLALDSGLDIAHVLSFDVDPPRSGHTGEAGKEFMRTLMARIQSVPGVSAAGAARVGLFQGGSWNSILTIEGVTRKPGERTATLNNAITPGYFATLGMRLVAGRAFTPQDDRLITFERDRTSSAVAIVNEMFVKQYLGGQSAIGRHVGFGRDPGTPTPMEIVGVVSDAKYIGLRDEIRPQIFIPILANRSTMGSTIYVRTMTPPETMFNTLRREIQRLDPNLPMFALQTFEERIDRSLTNERLVAGLSSMFGVLATLLAMIGLYGVMAYTVQRRTREIGIRMALGARSGMVAGMILREVGLLVAIGLAIGLPAAWLLGRYIVSQLYGIMPSDRLTMMAATLALIGVALLAGLIPARRAARINPITALRQD
jgi:putative ABC transport system permease protein